MDEIHKNMCFDVVFLGIQEHACFLVILYASSAVQYSASMPITSYG